MDDAAMNRYMEPLDELVDRVLARHALDRPGSVCSFCGMGVVCEHGKCNACERCRECAE